MWKKEKRLHFLSLHIFFCFFFRAVLKPICCLRFNEFNLVSCKTLPYKILTIFFFPFNYTFLEPFLGSDWKKKQSKPSYAASNEKERVTKFQGTLGADSGWQNYFEKVDFWIGLLEPKSNGNLPVVKFPQLPLDGAKTSWTNKINLRPVKQIEI